MQSKLKLVHLHNFRQELDNSKQWVAHLNVTAHCSRRGIVCMQWINTIMWAVVEGVVMSCMFLRKINLQRTDTQEKKNDLKKIIYIGIFVVVAAVLGWLASGAVQSILDCIKILAIYVFFSLAMVTDIRSCTIPNIFIIGMLLIRIVLMVFEFFLRRDVFGNLVKESLVGGFFCLIILLLVSFITKGGLGMGDVKLLSAQGFLIGLYGVINTVMYALVCCTICALFLIVTNKRSMKDKLPFAPFIFLGYVISIILGGY